MNIELIFQQTTIESQIFIDQANLGSVATHEVLDIEKHITACCL